MPHSSLFRMALLGAIALTGAQPLTAAEPERPCSAVATPDQRKDDDTIRRVEQDWLRAEYRGDVRFLDCLLEADYRVSARDGRVRPRAALLEQVGQKGDATRAVPTLESVVVVHGDGAVAHSILRTTDREGNAKEVHFVDAYTFHDGRWFAYGGVDL